MREVPLSRRRACRDRPCFVSVVLRTQTHYNAHQRLYRCRNRAPVRTRLSRTSPNACATTPEPDATIVCVGDIHGQWGASDERALEALNPDLVLFVGDYGDEDSVVTGRIGALAARAPFGVATVFGNHDAWYTAHAYGRSRAPSYGSRVAQQQAHLSLVDASYRARSFDALHMSVVGGRAFSWGGPHWKHRGFYREHVGVSSMEDSERQIRDAVKAAPRGHSLVFLAHVGPTGLGNRACDPCGRDWGDRVGGDWGDKDLRAAIDFAREDDRRIPLVVFGHMHRTLLSGQGARVMLATERDAGGRALTVMLNAAVVPRHKPWSGMGMLHNFHVVRMRDGGVREVEEVWASADGRIVQSYVMYCETEEEHAAIGVT